MISSARNGWGNPRFFTAGFALFMCLVAIVFCSCSDSYDEEIVQEKHEELTWTPRTFGSYVARDYQYGWLVTLAYQYTASNYFVTNLDDTDNQSFYGGMYLSNYWKFLDSAYNGGGVDHLSGGIDTVDLFFNTTHGGKLDELGNQNTVLAAYPTNYFEHSNQMRLGDDSVGLSIFATYACESMEGDAYTWTRWGNAFAGGLRIGLGTPAPAAGGGGMAPLGNLFADALQAGVWIGGAWFTALTGPYSANPASAMATGTDNTDCWNRLNNMTWQNFKNASYPRRRDGSIGVWCMYEWNDDAT